MNCILYSGLVTTCNQISQNVDTTTHCPITTVISKLLYKQIETYNFKLNYFSSFKSF